MEMDIETRAGMGMEKAMEMANVPDIVLMHWLHQATWWLEYPSQREAYELVVLSQPSSEGPGCHVFVRAETGNVGSNTTPWMGMGKGRQYYLSLFGNTVMSRICPICTPYPRSSYKISQH